MKNQSWVLKLQLLDNDRRGFAISSWPNHCTGPSLSPFNLIYLSSPRTHRQLPLFPSKEIIKIEILPISTAAAQCIQRENEKVSYAKRAQRTSRPDVCKTKLLNWWLQEPDMPPSMLFIGLKTFSFTRRRLFFVVSYCARFFFQIIYGVTSFLFGSNERGFKGKVVKLERVRRAKKMLLSRRLIWSRVLFT